MNAVPRKLSSRLPSDAEPRRTRLFTGVIALAALAGLGVVGMTFDGSPAPSGPSTISVKNVATSTISTSTTTSSSASSSAGTSTSASTPTPPTPTPTPLDDLYRVLPPGFSATSCGPSDTPTPQALATVDCGLPEQGGGPTSGRFSLFADASALASAFQIGVNEDAASQCPGNIDSPRSWQDPATPAFAAGSLLCGTHDDVPDLMWTKNDVLLLGDVRGPDLTTLYQWWLDLG